MLFAAVTNMNIQLNRFKRDPLKDDKYLAKPSQSFIKALSTLITTSNNAFINKKTAVTVLDFNSHRQAAKLTLKTIIIATFQLLLFSGRTFDSYISQTKILIQTINAYIIVCSSPTKLARFLNNINLSVKINTLDIAQLQKQKQNIQALLAQSFKLSQIPSQFIDKNKLNLVVKQIDIAIKAKSSRQAVGTIPSKSPQGALERNRFGKVRTNLVQFQKNKGLSSKDARKVVRENTKNMKRRMNIQQGAVNKQFYKNGTKNTIKFNRFARKIAQKDTKDIKRSQIPVKPPKLTPPTNKKLIKLQITQKYKTLKSPPKNIPFQQFKAKTMAEIKQLQNQLKGKPVSVPSQITPPTKSMFGKVTPTPPTKPMFGRSKSLPSSKKKPFRP